MMASPPGKPARVFVLALVRERGRDVDALRVVSAAGQSEMATTIAPC